MEEWTKDQIKEMIAQQGEAMIYFYTPLCGTCQLASRMLGILEEMTGLIFAKADLNYMPDLAEEWKIESVPCLAIVRDGAAVEKVYAFRSVEHLLGIVHKYEER